MRILTAGVAAFLFGSCAQHAPAPDNSRLPTVVALREGRAAERGDFPWHAAVLWLGSGGPQDPYGDYNCGAAVIDRQWLVTAAHCVMGRSRWRVLVGVQCLPRLSPPTDCTAEESGGVSLEATAIPHPEVRHAGYRLFVHDIALLRLDKPLPPGYPALQLPSASEEISMLNGNLRVSGWGFTKCAAMRPYHLRYSGVQRRDGGCPPPHDILNRFCAVGNAGQDTNEGDSGSPLSYRSPEGDYLLGLSAGGAPCDSPNRFGGYTRIVPYLGWINSVLCRYKT